MVLERQSEIRQVADYISGTVGVTLGFTITLCIVLGVALGVAAFSLPGSTGQVLASYGIALEIMSVLLLILPARASSTMTRCLQDLVRAPGHSMLGWAARRRTGRLALFAQSSEEADAIRLAGLPVRPGLIVRLFSVVGTIAVLMVRVFGSGSGGGLF